MKNKNTLTLELFNVVEKGQSQEPIFLDSHGVFVDSTAVYAIKDIKKHLKNLKLSGNELNKTFHKSWKTVVNSTRLELAIQQIMHYLSTYGSNFESEMYIPDEVLKVPKTKLKVSVIKSLTKEELIEKSLDVLRSGIALKEETLNDLFELLGVLGYKFSGDENIKNKEANLLIAIRYRVYPESVEEFVRYLVYRATQSSSLVKNKELFDSIKESNTDISLDLESYDMKKVAQVFNRFKPIFLSFKQAHKNNKKYINKLAKLSKVYHKPMPQNALNLVTQNKLTENDTHWLDNASIYALFKALSACYTRMNGQDTFVYRIRNGKSFVKSNDVNTKVVKANYKFLLNYLKTKLNGEGKNVFIPKQVVYALPTSEKLFVGNIPTGTKFLAKKIAAGIYWENSWGASDLDLSGLNIAGKIGWNSSYYNDNGNLIYSGDLTYAEDGAVEYLHASRGKLDPTLVMNNVFSGEHDAGYKIVIGEGSKISRNFMMNPNKVLAEVKCNSVQKNTVLGMLMEEDDDMKSFTLLNFGAGQARVSGNNEVSRNATTALYQQWAKPISLNTVLEQCGFTVLHEKEDDVELYADLSLDNLTKSTFIDLFKQD
tara:strand:- start:12697 stop:14490 length:1794 start_codon:yes stop_codon:yes gene_type:complete